jgi:hypothetical protein
MSNSLGPIDIQCDAPPYTIVRAGRRIGLQRPEDVRWFRLSHFLKQQESRAAGVQSLKAFLGLGVPAEKTCTCGQKLPTLERYTFTLLKGSTVSYLLAQCGRCHTIFWDPA